ncbi:MAG: LCP family protein, partial [Solirubrobacterales bacterium]
LRARAAGKGPEPRETTRPAPPAPPAAEPAAPPSPPPEKPPRARPLWARFVAASLLIVISMATATSVSLLVYLTDIAEGLGDNDALASLRDQLEEVDGGDPQTILIIGSDKRLGEEGIPGRSDTAILLRVDPDKDAIALLSIPRDLKVNIPGVGVDKFNVAYSSGGADRTLDVVKQITGLKINHVVNINFTGFADAVNAIGCVYIDVDRRYFIPPEANYAEIDIEAGYQRLCGLKALQYVRYRFDDNDLVRSARQQDFLREARQKLPPGTLIRDRNELLDIFTEYTTSDIADAVQLLELLKTFAGVQTAPVSEVHFPAELGDGSSPYVTTSEDAIQNAVEQFLGVEGTPGARPAGTAEGPATAADGKEQQRRKKQKEEPPEQEGPPMIDASAAGQQYGQAIAGVETKGGEPMVRFPIFHPTRLVPGSVISDASRAFPIDGPDKEKYYGYKIVVSVPGPSGFSEYYGVSGTSWDEVPILENASETREIDGREYQLFFDGDRLRLIGWKENKATYWVNNTLLQTLDEGEMISIATSMRELGG